MPDLSRPKPPAIGHPVFGDARQIAMIRRYNRDMEEWESTEEFDVDVEFFVSGSVTRTVTVRARDKADAEEMAKDEAVCSATLDELEVDDITCTAKRRGVPLNPFGVR